MTYVMSDLHGHKDKYDAMLEKIGLADGDRLYVVGDIVDRGNQPVALAREIMSQKNVTCLMGNHEFMCLQAMHPDTTGPEVLENWFYNGGAVTRDQLNLLPADERRGLLNWMLGLPHQAEVEVNGRKFLLVHGAPADTLYQKVWSRPDPRTFEPIPDVTVIVGHTPVNRFHAPSNHRGYFIKQAVLGQHLRVYHGDGFMGIDCGLAYQDPTVSALACVRLDDMAEFYA